MNSILVNRVEHPPISKGTSVIYVNSPFVLLVTHSVCSL